MQNFFARHLKIYGRRNKYTKAPLILVLGSVINPLKGTLRCYGIDYNYDHGLERLVEQMGKQTQPQKM